jgi:hypothetical protein
VEHTWLAEAEQETGKELSLVLREEGENGRSCLTAVRSPLKSCREVGVDSSNSEGGESQRHFAEQVAVFLFFLYKL